MPIFKNFSGWFKTKPGLEKKKERLKFREREIWYVYWGVNIGFEMNGKNDFLRPCLILKKLSNETFYALPLTSKLKSGSWYFPSKLNNQEGRYVFSQLRLVDAKRLKYCAAQVSRTEFKKVKESFINFLN